MRILLGLAVKADLKDSPEDYPVRLWDEALEFRLPEGDFKALWSCLELSVDTDPDGLADLQRAEQLIDRKVAWDSSDANSPVIKEKHRVFERRF